MRLYILQTQRKNKLWILNVARWEAERCIAGQVKAGITEVIRQRRLHDTISQVAKSICYLNWQIELMLHYRL